MVLERFPMFLDAFSMGCVSFNDIMTPRVPVLLVTGIEYDLQAVVDQLYGGRTRATITSW